jgi:uncharacterized protein (DUF1015 family)
VADVRPFAAVRYDQSRAGDLAVAVCAPYDVISNSEQQACYARSEFNAIRLEFGSENAGDGIGNNRYTRARGYLDAWRERGILTQDERPAMYLSEETFSRGGRTQTRRGLTAIVRLAEWSERVVLPHERTMSKPKADRLNLLRETQTQFSPILALYDDPTGSIRDVGTETIASSPIIDVTIAPDSITEAASRHRVWQLREPDVVSRALAGRQLVIADGHHRYETALQYRADRRLADPQASPDASFEFAMFQLLDVADPGLVVLPTHRLVRGIDSLDTAGVLAGWSSHFDIERLQVGHDSTVAADTVSATLARLGESGRVAFGAAFAGDDAFHILTLRALPEEWNAPASWRRIDVGVLHALVLDSLSGSRSGTEPELTFSRDLPGAIEAVWTGNQQVALIQNALDVRAIMEVASAGDRMPEKSTYFSPKPVTGLAMYDLR